MKNELPIKTELILYKHLRDTFSFLLLKRSAEDGGFWQPITGTVEAEESIIDCLHREMQEETGIVDPLIFLEEVYQFTWKKEGEIILELVYAAETDQDMIVLSDEHTDYRWCGYEEALGLLKHKENKTALTRLNHLIAQSSE